MPYKIQTEFKINLVTTQPVHIGTDSAFNMRLDERLTENEYKHFKKNLSDRVDEEQKNPVIYATAKAKGNKPVLPVSALRGVLAPFLSQSTVDFLFGGAKQTDGISAASHLYLTPGIWKSAPKNQPKDLPFWDANKATYVLPHNWSDKNNKTRLYHLEYIPTGTRFTLNGVCFAGFDEAGPALQEMFNILKGGIKIGGLSGKAKGGICLAAHLVTLKQSTAPSLSAIMQGDESEENEFALNLTPMWCDGRSVCEKSFLLNTSGPYYIRDPNRITYQKENKNKVVFNVPEWESGMITSGDYSNDIKATSVLREKDGEPVLTGEAVKHGLRVRAAFLDGIGDNFHQACNDPKDLTSVQRLFGTAGWKGLLEISEIRLCGQQPKDKFFHGLKIGVVSHGNVDKYITQAVFGLSYVIDIKLRQREFNKTTYPNDADKKLFERLCADIIADGIELGAESATGFGWFDVKAVNSDKPTAAPETQAPIDGAAEMVESKK